MTIHYASPTGGFTDIEGDHVDTLRLPDALARLEPGDTLKLAAGTYSDPGEISVQGLPLSEVTIVGARDGDVVLDGRQPKENGRSEVSGATPRPEEFAFLKLLRAHRVTISGLSFRNCWPSAIYMAGCNRIAIKDCDIQGGRYGVYAVNAWIRQRTKRITLSNVTWIQDVEQSMWKGAVTWADVKQQKHEKTPNDATYFNGALFGSWNAKGPITITGCTVAHAFNAVHIRAEEGTTGNRNLDIRIIANRFSYIRDNAIEPEGYAERLWVLDNAFLQVHATFSFDGVGGRDWFLFGNRVLNISKPGLHSGGHRSGKVFKFYPNAPFPCANFNCGFNSVQTRSEYVGDGTTRHWQHRNNAIGFCLSGPDCDPDVRMFRRNADVFVWDDTIQFGDDLCNHPGFPDSQIADGYLVSGLHAGAVTFQPPNLDPAREGETGYWDGTLALAADSPGESTSVEMKVQLPDGRIETLPRGRDFGAPAPQKVLDWAREEFS